MVARNRLLAVLAVGVGSVVAVRAAVGNNYYYFAHTNRERFMKKDWLLFLYRMYFGLLHRQQLFFRMPFAVT